MEFIARSSSCGSPAGAAGHRSILPIERDGLGRRPQRQSYPADVTTAAVTRNFAADSGRRFTSAPEDDVVTDRRRMRSGGGDYDGRVAQRMKDSGRRRTIGSDTNVEN